VIARTASESDRRTNRIPVSETTRATSKLEIIRRSIVSSRLDYRCRIRRSPRTRSMYLGVLVTGVTAVEYPSRCHTPAGWIRKARMRHEAPARVPIIDHHQVSVAGGTKMSAHGRRLAPLQTYPREFSAFRDTAPACVRIYARARARVCVCARRSRECACGYFVQGTSARVPTRT